MIIKLDSAIFYVSNMDQALDFYTKILMFKVVENQGEYVTLQIGDNGGVLLALNSKHRPFQSVGKQTIVVISNNNECDYEKLLNLGVKIFDKLETHSWGKYFAIEDIDGNHIDISEEK